MDFQFCSTWTESINNLQLPVHCFLCPLSQALTKQLKRGFKFIMTPWPPPPGCVEGGGDRPVSHRQFNKALFT